MKKTSVKVGKLIGSYILFGIVSVIVISICGAYKAFVINQALGGMTTIEYVMCASVIALGWLPTAITVLLNGNNIFTFPFATPFITAVVVLFIALCIRIITKK